MVYTLFSYTSKGKEMSNIHRDMHYREFYKGEDMNEIRMVLEERERTYGSFKIQAQLSQGLKEIIMPMLDDDPEYLREGMEMILHKIARIANGDVKYLDSYVDIIGYTQLIIDEIEKENTKGM